ncbi:DNA repair protein XRCC1 [Anopheles ziemanni]|uniref:DNA repair protein XRCC1 n=1 Tax=Anopheles ziemanni TaxID=345580 RepID=UPI00265A2C2F|nr:DNA repair protein XRCC1 isoform X2 [Anopheles coustani]XP_058174458.1 DNA repair protein XRCC1 [Anopheles ziemanni]
MASVNLISIESFSSEDPHYPASNLLKAGNKKWKCREAGEKNAFVVIRLEEPVRISGIDIGNEHSAFIEVLVARSGPSNPDFTEILLSTRFMGPVESRNSTSPNGVQIFNKSTLVPSAADDRWDLVKIICTQPFNARVKYGLTFVTIRTASGERKEKSLVPERFQKQIKEEAEKRHDSNVISFGRFKLREDSPDSDGGEAAGGSLNVFARWKEKLKPNTLSVTTSVSALMRDSVTPEAVKKNVPTPGSVRSVNTPRPKPQRFDSSDEDANLHKGKDKPKANRNSVAVLYDEEDEKPDNKFNDSMARYQTAEQKQEKQRAGPKEAVVSKKSSKLHDVSSSKFREFLDLTGQSMDRDPKRTEEKNKPKVVEKPPKASHSSPPAKRMEEISKPKQVENPHRPSYSSPPYDKNKTPVKVSTNVRTPALPIERELVPKKRLSSPSPTSKGSESCSPSSKKPKSSSPPVKSDEEVLKRVQYKPFGRLLENVVLVISGIQNPERGTIRNQALAMGAKYKPDWDSSCTHLICAYKNTPKYNQVRGKGKIIKKEWIECCYNNRKRYSWRKFAIDTDEANVSDSEDEIVDITKKPPEPVSSTDARVEDQDDDVVEVEEPVMLHELVESDSDDGAARGTRVYDVSTEDEGDANDENSNNEFFKDKTFYLDSELAAVDVIKLEKYIHSHNGTLSKVLQDVDYVITRQKHKLPPSSKAKLVKPLWIYECGEMECLIPIDRYLV